MTTYSRTRPRIMSEKAPVALVTGIGPGTGAAIARRFSQGGYKVAMLARTRDRLDALEGELPNAKAYPCDVTDENQLDSVIQAVQRDLGAPKVLVHNAVGGVFGNFLEIDPQALLNSFQVNTMSIRWLCCTWRDGWRPRWFEAGEGAMW